MNPRNLSFSLPVLSIFMGFYYGSAKAINFELEVKPFLEQKCHPTEFSTPIIFLFFWQVTAKKLYHYLN